MISEARLRSISTASGMLDFFERAPVARTLQVIEFVHVAEIKEMADELVELRKRFRECRCGANLMDGV